MDHSLHKLQHFGFQWIKKNKSDPLSGPTCMSQKTFPQHWYKQINNILTHYFWSQTHRDRLDTSQKRTFEVISMFHPTLVLHIVLLHVHKDHMKTI